MKAEFKISVPKFEDTRPLPGTGRIKFHAHISHPEHHFIVRVEIPCRPGYEIDLWETLIKTRCNDD